jgi:tRNA dimethylallyltransferase
MFYKKKYLILILGPTASGKTSLSIELANYFNTEIISTDSRQFYKRMDIGTAKPNSTELSLAKHHFIDFLEPEQYYSAGDFERDAIKKLDELFIEKDIVIATGGSGLFVTALVDGLDEMPKANLELRANLESNYAENGIEFLQNELKQLNPQKWDKIEQQNPQRLMRAIEMSKQGVELGKIKKPREFETIKIGIDWPREELYQRINSRVDIMRAGGLEKEARELYQLKHLNALQTVGYQELFDYFDGTCNLEYAFDKIKQHSRNYAKRQLTWFKKDTEIIWKKSSEITDIKELIKNNCQFNKAQ